MLKNTSNSYGTVAKTFHWLLFLMLTFSIVMGNFLAAMPKGAEKLQAAGMHKSFGAILLTLILLRFLWRLINKVPESPEGTTAAQEFLAKGMHWVLYILMFAQPLSGILMSQAGGFPISFFGLSNSPCFSRRTSRWRNSSAACMEPFGSCWSWAQSVTPAQPCIITLSRKTTC